MNRDNLVPEQRPTKDGTLVTRWVKNEKKNKKKPGKSTSLPAPGLVRQRAEVGNPEHREIAKKISLQKDEKKRQKAVREAENFRQLDYIKTEARLRLKYKDSKRISSVEVSGVLKALREGGFEDPSEIVDEDLLISYAEFTDFAWTPFHENDDLSIAELNYSELYRPHVTKLAAHYVTHPEDRETLAKLVSRGIYDYDKVMAELGVDH